MKEMQSMKWWILGGLLVGFIYLLQPILTPFLLGGLCAYLGDPLVSALQKRGLKRNIAVVLVFICGTLLLLLTLLLVTPLLADQLEYLQGQMPLILQSVQTFISPLLEKYFGLKWQQASLQEWFNIATAGNNWKTASDFIAPILTSLSKSGLVLVGWFASMALVPVVTFYLLRDWPHLLIQLKTLLPRHLEPQIIQLTLSCHEVLGAFFRGQLLVMLAVGMIYTLGLWILGLKLALLIGMLAGLASIIPYLGFSLGIISALLAAAVQFQDGIHLAWVVLVFTIGQLLEGTILTPILVGDRIGLHPVAVIFSVLAGAQLFGFFGMLLALPVSAMILVLLRFMREKYLNSAWYGAAKTSAITEQQP